MTISIQDLPKHADEAVILDLNDGSTMRLEKRASTYYGFTEKFDVEENGSMIVAKLNAWGARVAGWES